MYEKIYLVINIKQPFKMIKTSIYTYYDERSALWNETSNFETEFSADRNIH